MIYSQLKRDVLRLFYKKKFYEIFITIHEASNNEDVRTRAKPLLSELAELLNEKDKEFFLKDFKDFASKNMKEDLSYMGLEKEEELDNDNFFEDYFIR